MGKSVIKVFRASKIFLLSSLPIPSLSLIVGCSLSTRYRINILNEIDLLLTHVSYQHYKSKTID